MTEHNDENNTAADDGRDKSEPISPWLRFLVDDRGQVMIEYVILVTWGFIISVYLTCAPLKTALVTFATDVVEHLQYP